LSAECALSSLTERIISLTASVDNRREKPKLLAADTAVVDFPTPVAPLIRSNRGGLSPARIFFSKEVLFIPIVRTIYTPLTLSHNVITYGGFDYFLLVQRFPKDIVSTQEFFFAENNEENNYKISAVLLQYSRFSSAKGS
jgi:hypothetical protein